MTPKAYINTPESERYKSETMSVFIDVLNNSYLSLPIADNAYVYQAVAFYVTTVNKSISRFSDKKHITEHDFMNYLIQSHVDNNGVPHIDTGAIKRNIAVYADRARDLKNMQSIYQLLPNKMYRERLKRSKKSFKDIEKQIKSRFKDKRNRIIISAPKAPYKFHIT